MQSLAFRRHLVRTRLTLAFTSLPKELWESAYTFATAEFPFRTRTLRAKLREAPVSTPHA